MDDNQYAMIQGSLANNPMFFGSATAEIASTLLAGDASGWNSDSTQTVFPVTVWQIRSGTSVHGVRAGVLATGRYSGEDRNVSGHRTILLGY
ncbi:hypothetical protein FWG76_01830 [Candidatus Saccharibacteria bacterium]|nr:hypothetical protein [Candidatus Saccharibacteria bacterium]